MLVLDCAGFEFDLGFLCFGCLLWFAFLLVILLLIVGVCLLVVLCISWWFLLAVFVVQGDLGFVLWVLGC